MRRAVFNMRDERPVWAPPSEMGARIAGWLGDEWDVVDVAAPVSGRGDGSGVSADALTAVRGAEIHFGLGLPRELLLAGLESGRLRWIHTGAAGVASLLHPELIDSGVTLTNSAGIHAEPMADTVLAMMLHLLRGLDFAVRAQQQREWRTGPFEQIDSGVREIAGATLGIIGYGGIGRAVARRGVALGMHVLALRRSSNSTAEPGVSMLAGATALRTLLERSDVVVVSVPSTPATRDRIGAQELAWLRRDAILINVARGDVIAEAALADALQAGRLRGAALDVFRTEPLPHDSPLWSLPNVLITPHVSATSTRFWEREGELIHRNIERYLAGAPLLNTVDVRAGY